MDTRETSILVQVAFKGAVEIARGDLDLTTDEGQAAFEAMFGYMTDSLLAAVRAANGAPAPAAVQVVTSQTNEEVLTAAFPGSTVETVSSVTVKGSQHGPLPDWLIKAAAAKGVTEVWDNRDRAQGTKRPWFKSTDTEGIGFWPPR